MSTSPRQAEKEFPKKIPDRFLAEKAHPKKRFSAWKKNFPCIDK
jgi:hypothetical protein